MSTLSVAVAGAGFIGPVHVEALKRLDIPVVGILGSSPAKSRAAAERLGIAKAYANFDELIADKNVQSVHLATPNRVHFAQAKQALLAGKHVLCEKPLAMNSAESRELAALAARCNVAAGVNYNVRYYPLALQARTMAASGALGDVFSICGSYAQDWLFHPTDYNWRVAAGEGGPLRAVADIGTHWLDLVYSITGLEVESVCADLRTVYPVRERPAGEVETFSGKLGARAKSHSMQIDTEDFGCVMLRFKGGARGNVWVSQVNAGRKNCLRYELAGSKCAIAWNSERPDELWIGHRDKANEILLRDPALVGELARGHIGYPGGHNEGFPDTFKQCFKSFYDSIATGAYKSAPSFPTFSDGHREIVLCEAILRSHRERKWIDIVENV